MMNSSPMSSMSSPESKNTSTSSHVYYPFTSSSSVSPTSQTRAGRVFSPDMIPFTLNKLSRSPKEILEKKFQMTRNVGDMEMEAGEGSDRMLMVGEGEAMVQLKLFYLGVINNLQNRAEVEIEAVGVKALVEKSKKLEKELEQIRGKVGCVDVKKKDLEDQLTMIRRETECLELVRKENESKHLDVIISFQKKMENCLTDLTRIQTSSSTPIPETVPAAALAIYSKVFPSPPSSPPFPLPPPSGGLLQFSNLFCLSGQLAQFAQGQNGSKLVVDRLREGTDPERDLVREELGLPRSLRSILETGNVYCREVVLVLVETDMRTRLEVVELLERNREGIVRILGGMEFGERVMKLVRRSSV